MIFFKVLAFLSCTISVLNAEDYYSSISGLEDLLEAETYLIESLENFIATEQQKINNVNNYLSYVDNELAAGRNQTSEYYGNPLNSLRIIKRTLRDWTNWQAYVENNYNEHAFQQGHQQAFVKTGIQQPVADDLLGAAKGISLIQKTYKLNPTDIANGYLKELNTQHTLSASDCFDIGLNLFYNGKFKYAARWLSEARIRLSQEIKENPQYLQFPQLSDDTIVPLLANATFQSGNTKLSYLITSDYLKNHPNDIGALHFQEVLQKDLTAQRLSQFSRMNNKKDQPSYVNDLYQKTCNGELKPSPSAQRKLRCRYEDNEVPFCLIAPFKMEELSLDPYVAMYHEVMYDSEIDNIMEVTNEKLERSKTGSSTNSAVSEIRTSKQTWLDYAKNPFLDNISQRLTDITGLSLETAEYLQVANYGIGGHYAPHFDFFEDGADSVFGGKGNRILTALFYINHVELGGGTAFPFLNLLVPPQRRSLVMWYNLHESLELDYRTKHAGCPVLKGSKWICNEWYHSLDQEFYRPCGLEEDGHISIKYKSYI